ncbi:SubName: Full=Uncharacterized protein {ECO:0000313/EMBL:CCA70854.1} [Serendipita indica DSM 11827]|uniref:F-box domain-containing protein n=1 Tax=Serendipita indica (strain DSM 11827) TaxID=1109443 RepID=G4THR1_SERID|nr:SubName: Full=Uncharacterized protein {ECO:0000313/EMBL:CCA70854.1} [Serendipita indica DSM 11827]CCA70854.1 hypothetical protein PIIN_04789 [Serendipita indica DSM 11827]
MVSETKESQRHDFGPRDGNQSSPTEFLTMLPDELWREILDQVYPSRDGMAAVPSAFTSWGHAIGVIARDPMRRMRAMQKYRSQLRLVCKRLEPIALGVLFQDIILPHHHTELELLFEIAQETHGAPSSPGDLTRRLMTRLCFPDEDGEMEEGKTYDRQLDLIHKTFPNINTLIIDDAFSTKVTTFYLDWITGVKHLCWYPSPLKYEQVVQILAQNPELQSFVLSSPSGSLYCWPKHAPPWGNMKQFFIGYPPHTPFLATLPPDLDRLGFTFGTHLALDLSRLSSKMLTSLEVHWSTSRERPLIMDDILSLLYACPRLEVFTTSTCYSFVAPKASYEAHPSLRTLCITNAVGLVDAMLRQWGIIRSCCGYPHFNRVLVLTRPTYMMQVADSLVRFLHEEHDIPLEFVLGEL